MQIRDKEGIKKLPVHDFIINNLSKKQMMDIGAQLGMRLRPGMTKTFVATQIGQMYLYFPTQVSRIVSDEARERMQAFLRQDCEGDADAPGVSQLVALGMAMILRDGETRLAVVPCAYRDSALFGISDR